MSTTIKFPYKDTCLSECHLPQERLSMIYEMEPVTPLVDLKVAVINAMANPIGTASLKEIASHGKKAAVIVDDLSRPTPAALIIPFVIEELLSAGIAKQDIVIIMALGSHRRMTEKEIIAKIGGEIAREYRVINSRFWDPDHLCLVGTSGDGVKIFIEEEVAKADIKIGIGSIVPHAAVGWSGGGKILYPGVAGKETVAHFHFTHGLTEENMTGREECIVRTCMESWVDIVGLDFIVNSILTPDNQVYKIVAGHYRQAQRKGVQLARKVYSKKIIEKTDLVIAVSYTHDMDFWQGTKGIYSGEPLVKDGGTLLLISPCYEGLGLHKDFPARIGADDNAEIMKKILKGILPMPADPLPYPPGAMLARLRKRIHCSVVSPGLTAGQLGKAGYEKFSDIQSAVDTLLKRYPAGKVALVMRSDLTFYE